MLGANLGLLLYREVSVMNVFDRLVITDEYSVKCVFILNSYFYRRNVKYFIKKILKM